MALSPEQQYAALWAQFSVSTEAGQAYLRTLPLDALLEVALFAAQDLDNRWTEVGLDCLESKLATDAPSQADALAVLARARAKP